MLIKEWLLLCENYHFLDKSSSIQYKDFSYYSGNDCDNSIFNVCLSKHKEIVHKIYPDETNIYIDNKQCHHVLDKNKLSELDWQSLDKYPFHCKRLTPKFLN